MLLSPTKIFPIFSYKKKLAKELGNLLEDTNIGLPNPVMLNFSPWLFTFSSNVLLKFRA